MPLFPSWLTPFRQPPPALSERRSARQFWADIVLFFKSLDRLYWCLLVVASCEIGSLYTFVAYGTTFLVSHWGTYKISLSLSLSLSILFVLPFWVGILKPTL